MKIKFTAIALISLIALQSQAQQATSTPDAPASTPQGAAARMKAVMEAITTGNVKTTAPAVQRAIDTGKASADKSSTLEMPASTVEYSLRQAEQWQQMSREAYVAALPPRDRARGASLLLGDGTLPGHQGKLYIFVSRSMPMSLLRAYAVDALYSGATLVTKGIRKGDTIKEYIEEAVADFNNAEGQILAGLEVNPNLFDMYQVKTVPTVVWTNRVGLDDIGSGCQDLPEGAAIPQLEMTGPDDRTMLVDRPTCAPVNESGYYKMSGALKLNYVLDRFEDAGLPKAATKVFRDGLVERDGNVFQGTQDGSPKGNAMGQIVDDIKLDRMPRRVLLEWKHLLATETVQRGPNGPVFGDDAEEDPVYRKELQRIVDHGLGL